MPLLANIVLTLLAIPALLSCAYLLILTFLSARLPIPSRSSRQLRFDVVVPAYNEESGIESTVRSLLATDWDADRMRVHVVADNCTDRTAELARAAGAHVIVRHNLELRGKGYAVAHAFTALLAEGWSDALVVVDADAVVSENLLEAYAARLESGESAVQAHHGIRNPMVSWRTRLITVAQGAFHIVRSRARERLHLSCGIRGNGWCITKQLLQNVPYKSFSLTEDIEYGIAIGRAGYRVAYADEAYANAEMVTSASIAERQRQRWESGRFEMISKHSLSLLQLAIRSRNAVCMDLAFDLLVLPLSYVLINILALIALAGAFSLLVSSALAWVWVGVACTCALLLHVLRGWQVSKTGIRGFTALAYVPGFVLWKIVIMMRRKTSEWVRTEREVP
jgi:cellulose synthase/poly-beta-1,6-N-acetylglucosamine synthase-like glycosyltransferase